MSDQRLVVIDESPRPGGNLLRWAATAIVVFCAPMLCLVGLVGLFTDGVNPFERVLIGVINPIVGLAAAWAMLDEDFWTGWGARVGIAAAVALVGNIVASIAIAAEWSSGDWEIPAILAIPFAAYVAYRTLVRLATGRVTVI